MKLDSGSIHLLRLAARDADAEGWTKVSAQLWRPIIAALPDDLVEKQEGEDGGGRIRLTSDGKAVLKYS